MQSGGATSAPGRWAWRGSHQSLRHARNAESLYQIGAGRAQSSPAQPGQPSPAQPSVTTHPQLVKMTLHTPEKLTLCSGAGQRQSTC